MPEAPAASGERLLPHGVIRWWRNGAVRAPALFLCAHGAGAPSSSAFMLSLCTGLVQRGITVVRFDFPYMTRATRGRRALPDSADVLLESCQAMLDIVGSGAATDGISPARLVVGGKSMGGRMWSMLLANQAPPSIAAALYLGYPLHPPGKPARLRSAHLQSIRVPQLFISGSRDSLARLELLRAAVDTLPRARLHVVEGGDHSLALGKRRPLDGSDTWLDVAAGFIRDPG